MTHKKKTRSPKYSEEEKTLLLSVITAYLGARANKKTDPANTKEKGDGWEVIAVEFNAKCARPRTKESLKMFHENLQRLERRAKANPTAKGGGDIQKSTRPRPRHSRLCTALPELVKPKPPRTRPSYYARKKQREADDAMRQREAHDAKKQQEANDAKKQREADDAMKRQEADAAAKSQDAVTIPQAEAADFMEHFLEGSDVPAGVLVEPDDGWPPSHHPKRGPSPHGYSWQPLDYVSARLDDTRQDHLDEVRLEVMREDARHRRAQEEDDYATRKRVKQDEAELRIKILETELLIKKEILKQETKKTKAMDRMEV